MTAVSHTISSLLNGVSQQPALARLASQLEAQEDCFSSLVDGLIRRPPLEHLAKLALATAIGDYTNAIVHSVNRDDFERYTLVIRNGDIEVFDTLTGAAKTVNKPNGTAYLNTADPQANLRVLTVEDYTFIVNRTKTVALSTELAASGVLYQSVNKLSDLSASGLGPGLDYPNAYVRVGNNPDPTQGAASIYYVSYFPGNYATPGGAVPTVPSTGYWAEVPATGTHISFDASTMPHALISNGDGTFTFKQIDWPKRVAGDEVNHKAPSFVGKKIQDVFFARRRLGFVAGTCIVASRGGGDFFNFWRERASQLVATDPIDIDEKDSDALGGFHAATAINQEVVIWSNKAQWRIAATDAFLSPNTIDVRKVSIYDNSKKCRPLATGDAVYFPVELDNWAQLMELVLSADLKVATAPSVSDHIPSYIPTGVTKLVSSPKARTLIVRTGGDLDALYVWTHMEQAGQRQQSSWSRWNMPLGATVLDISIDQWLVIVALKFADGIYLHKINLAPWVPFANTDHYRVHLDRRLYSGQVGIVFGSGVSTFTLPYAVTAGVVPYLVPTVTDPALGIPAPIALTATGNAAIWTAPGDYTASTFTIGLMYPSWVELSELFPPRAENSASADRTLTDEGGLTLQAILYTVDKTSALAGGVWAKLDEEAFGFQGLIPIDGVPAPETLPSPTVPSAELIRLSGKAGSTRRKTAKIRQPVHMKASRAIIRIGSIEHRPFAILSAKWNGDYTYTRQQV
jgi:hypothetical protein